MVVGWIGTPVVIAYYTQSMWAEHPGIRGAQDSLAKLIYASEEFKPLIDTPLKEGSTEFGQMCVQRLAKGEFAELRLEKSGGGQRPITWRVVGIDETQCILMPAGEYQLTGRMGGAWFGESRGFGWGGRSFKLEQEVWFHGTDKHMADLIAVL